MAEDGWREVQSEHPPKDGSRVLIVLDGVDRPVLAHWNGAEWITFDNNNWAGRTITHWRPLPPMPDRERLNTPVQR